MQLLVSNPDMLHATILPQHRRFARILASLKYVVLDEGHAYKVSGGGGWGGAGGPIGVRKRRGCGAELWGRRASGAKPFCELSEWCVCV